VWTFPYFQRICYISSCCDSVLHCVHETWTSNMYRAGKRGGNGAGWVVAFIRVPSYYTTGVNMPDDRTVTNLFHVTTRGSTHLSSADESGQHHGRSAPITSTARCGQNGFCGLKLTTRLHLVSWLWTEWTHTSTPVYALLRLLGMTGGIFDWEPAFPTIIIWVTSSNDDIVSEPF
jgi:hypothetical protein